MTAQGPYRIGIAGLGTVGAGVVDLLTRSSALIAGRAGRPIEVVAVSARDKSRDRGVDVSGYAWVDDPMGLAGRPDLDAVVELIGGEGGVALALAERTLAAGKALVTANKALLARHGGTLAAQAESAGAPLLYEAAVAGGIPIVKAVREGFAANGVEAVYGILNGTCNYILTEMRETGRSFADVLKDAQAQGYAEADPSFDVGGIDAAHKLCILTSLAFGLQPDFESVEISGIENVTAADIALARDLGYRIKLLSVSRWLNGNIVKTVEPCLVPEHSSMGAVEGVFNAVLLEGDFVGTGLAVGRGAGRGPTASAVVADLIDLARGQGRVPVFGLPATALAPSVPGDSGALEARFYLRLTVIDRPGVLAEVTAILRDSAVSVETVSQHGRDPDKPVSLVLITHVARQEFVRKAASAIAALDVVTDTPALFRIETL